MSSHSSSGGYSPVDIPPSSPSSTSTVPDSERAADGDEMDQDEGVGFELSETMESFGDSESEVAQASNDASSPTLPTTIEPFAAAEDTMADGATQKTQDTVMGEADVQDAPNTTLGNVSGTPAAKEPTSSGNSKCKARVGAFTTSHRADP